MIFVEIYEVLNFWFVVDFIGDVNFIEVKVVVKLEIGMWF